MTNMENHDEALPSKRNHVRAPLCEVPQENGCIQNREPSSRDDNGSAEAIGPTTGRGAVRYQPYTTHAEAQRGESNSAQKLHSCLSSDRHPRRQQDTPMDAVLDELEQYGVCREMRIKFSKRQARLYELLDMLHEETENFRYHRHESEESYKAERQDGHVQAAHRDERPFANHMANPPQPHSPCSSAVCLNEDCQWSPWVDKSTPPLQAVARDILIRMPGASHHDKERSPRNVESKLGPPHAFARTTSPSSPRSGIVDDAGLHHAEPWLADMDAASLSTVVPDSALLSYPADGDNEPAAAEVTSIEPDSGSCALTAEGETADWCSHSFFSAPGITDLPLNAEDLALLDTARQLEQELVVERALHSQSCAPSSAALMDNEDADEVARKQSRASFSTWNTDCHRDQPEDDAPPSVRPECESESEEGAGEGQQSAFRTVGAHGRREKEAAVSPPAHEHAVDGDDRKEQHDLQKALLKALRHAERALGSRGDEETLADDDTGQVRHPGAVDATCDVRSVGVKTQRCHEGDAQVWKEHYDGRGSADVGSHALHRNNDLVRHVDGTRGARGEEGKQAFEDGDLEYVNGIRVTHNVVHPVRNPQHENGGQYRNKHDDVRCRMPYENNPVFRHVKRALGVRGDDEKRAHNIKSQDRHSDDDTTHEVGTMAGEHRQDDSGHRDNVHLVAGRDAHSASHVSRTNNVAVREAKSVHGSRREDKSNVDAGEAFNDDDGQEFFNDMRTTHQARNGADGRLRDDSGHYRTRYDGASFGEEVTSQVPNRQNAVLHYAERAPSSHWDESKRSDADVADDGQKQFHGVSAMDDVKNEGVGNSQRQRSGHYRQGYAGTDMAEPTSRSVYCNTMVGRHAETPLCSHRGEDERLANDDHEQRSGVRATQKVINEANRLQHDENVDYRNAHDGAGRTQVANRARYRNYVVAKRSPCSRPNEAEKHHNDSGQEQRYGVWATHNAKMAQGAPQDRIGALKECRSEVRNAPHTSGTRVAGSLLSASQGAQKNLRSLKEQIAETQCGTKVSGTLATRMTCHDAAGVFAPERSTQPSVSGADVLQRMNKLAASAIALLQATEDN